MPWIEILPAAKTVANKTAPITVSMSTGGKALPAKITIAMRVQMLTACAWLRPEAAVRVMLGTGDEHGKLRITGGGAGPHRVGRIALAKPEGSLVQVKIPVPDGLKAERQPSVPVEFKEVSGALEIVLPEWARPPEPRGTVLAREAAAEARRRAGL